MTQEEMDVRIDQAMSLVEGIPSIMLSCEIDDADTIRIRWNPIFLKYRDIMIKLGIIKPLDEIEFAVQILENAKKIGGIVYE